MELGRRRRRPARRTWVIVTAAAMSLLGLSWVFTNPPGGSPDEAANYVRAMGTAFGQFVPRPSRPIDFISTDPKLQRFNRIVVGSFTLPARYVQDSRWGCTDTVPPKAAVCLRAPLRDGGQRGSGSQVVTSYVAFYPPVVFFLEGLGGRLTPNDHDALYAGRLVDLALAVALLSVALAVSRGRWIMVGLLASVSPMVIFLASSLNPSSVEIAAGIAFAASLLALNRDDPNGFTWWAVQVSGVLLAVARQVGPVWVLLDALAVVLLMGPRTASALVRRQPVQSGLAVTAVALASLSTVIWDAVIGHAAKGTWHDTMAGIGPSFGQLQGLVDQFVGVFGWASVQMPEGVVLGTLVGYGALIVASLAYGDWRARGVLIGVGVVAVLVAVVLNAATQMPFGFTVQARYVMPLTALLLIMAGWIVERRPRARTGTHFPQHSRTEALRVPPTVLAALVGLAGLQFVGWLWNSRVSAVGPHGSWDFITHALWAPPGGWLLWTLTAVAGTLLLTVGIVALVGNDSAPARL